MHLARNAEEVNEVLNEAMETEDSGVSRFPGMSYEQGMTAAVQWLLGDSDDHPYPEA